MRASFNGVSRSWVPWIKPFTINYVADVIVVKICVISSFGFTLPQAQALFKYQLRHKALLAIRVIAEIYQITP